MRAGKARTLHTARHSTAVRQPVRRCICAFSTTCKSSEHDQPTSSTSASKYDRLWDGLFTSMDSLKVSSPRQAPRTADVSPRGPRFARSSPQSQTKADESTPPSISRFRAAFLSQLPPAVDQAGQPPPSGGKSTYHFGTMMGNAWPPPLDAKARDSNLSNRTPDPAKKETSARPADTTSSSGGVAWADLLAKIQETRQSNYPSMPASYQHREPQSRLRSPTQPLLGRQQDQAVSPSIRPAHVDESLHDRIFESQAESRRYSLALQEEVRELGNPAEALNWLQERLFDTSNEESLMSKIASTSDASELHNLYGDLLVDVTNYLRASTSPQSAFLPLILAKAHSPTSYLYGCTAKLYAANIRAKWEMYGDIQGVLELIQDMEKGAVHLNPMIKDYIKNMSLAVMADRIRAQREFDEEEEAAQSPQETSGTEATDIAGAQDLPIESAHSAIEPLPRKNHSTIKFLSNPKIESRLFFTNAQHRALREIEKLLVQDQERYFEAREREDNLHDSVLSRYGRAGNGIGRYGSGNIHLDQNKEEEDSISEVNALIGSYGKAVPVYSPRKQPNVATSYYDKDMSRGTRAGSPGLIRFNPPSQSIQPTSTETSYDVLNEAVSEASKERKSKGNVVTRELRRSKRSSKKIGTSTRALKEQVPGEKKQEFAPRLST